MFKYIINYLIGICVVYTVCVRCSCPTCHTDVTPMQDIEHESMDPRWQRVTTQTNDSCHVVDPGTH